jgi:hypothetical protein
MDQEQYDYGENEIPSRPKKSSMNDTDYQERYKRAKKRVNEIKEFYTHLAAFVCVNILVYIIDLTDNGNIDWAYWVTLGWGIGVVAHFFSVFGESIFLGHNWEERKIRQLMDEDEKPKRRG